MAGQEAAEHRMAPRLRARQRVARGARDGVPLAPRDRNERSRAGRGDVRVTWFPPRVWRGLIVRAPPPPGARTKSPRHTGAGCEPPFEAEKPAYAGFSR